MNVSQGRGIHIHIVISLAAARKGRQALLPTCIWRGIPYAGAGPGIRHSDEFLYHWIWLDTGGKSGGKYGKLRPFTLYPSHTLFAYPKNRKETPVRRYLLKQDPVVGLTLYCFYKSGHNPPLIHSSLQPFAQTIKKEMRPEGHISIQIPLAETSPPQTRFSLTISWPARQQRLRQP